MYAFHVLLVYGQGVGLAALVGRGSPRCRRRCSRSRVLALSCGAARSLIRGSGRPCPERGNGLDARP